MRAILWLLLLFIFSQITTIPSGTESNNIVFVWVHGFDGDETTFKSIPLLLSSEFDIPSIDHYLYDTKTPFEDVVDGLYKHIQPYRHKQIIFFAHSCGGLVVGKLIEKLKADEHNYKILGFAFFDVPFGGINDEKVINHLSQVSNVVSEFAKENPDIATAIGISFLGLSYIFSDELSMIKKYAVELVRKSSFLKIITPHSEEERRRIVTNILETNIPIFKADCAEGHMNYISTTMKDVEWTNTEHFTFKVKTLHPISHTRLFLDLENEDDVYREQQLKLYTSLKRWILRIINA